MDVGLIEILPRENLKNKVELHLVFQVFLFWPVLTYGIIMKITCCYDYNKKSFAKRLLAMEKREKFASRLGFILVSAGCAIGLGNVWKFPYMAGANGGAAFIMIYLLFLVILGLPVMVAEFAVGRGSQKSVAKSFAVLQKEGSNFDKFGYLGLLGSYLLMMFYTMVAGWILYYLYKMTTGKLVGLSAAAIGDDFGALLASWPTMTFWMILAVAISFGVCSLGLQNGVERITKFMMSALLILMVVMVIRVVTLPGATEGLKFFLVPNFDRLLQQGVGNVVFAAMAQAFFTLGLGVGSMAIFGSYLSKERSLMGEAISITLLDTAVALMAGLIVIPACFAFGVDPAEGPGLIFVALPNIFNAMPAGQIWGSLFFLFLCFAALSTVIAVFENIISSNMDLFGWTRGKAIIVNLIAIITLSMPCILGFNLWAGFQPFGDQTVVLDLEDFILSKNLLPLGAIVYLIFLTAEHGWGWQNFLDEVNAGKGLKYPNLKLYTGVILPLIILIVYVKGYLDFFAGAGLSPYLAVAISSVVLVAFGLIIFSRSKRKLPQ